MKVKSVLIISAIVLGLAIAVFVLLTPPDKAGQATTDQSDPVKLAEQNVSVIESIFGPGPDDSVTTLYELDTIEILDPPHEDNPGNPHTGKPYSDREMAQFEALRQFFPDNRMIPKRMTAEETKAYEEEEQELAKKYYVQRRVKILSGGLNKDEVDEYFAYRTRFTLDKIELFRYALDNLPEDAPEDRRKRMERLLDQNEQKITRVLGQKEAAYQKNGIDHRPGEIYLEDPNQQEESADTN
ncbi:MAG: hypothetical protein NXI24_05135 [bacterium]|nr:hypothetical protein [bacterium]